jgi:hypothetical protein
MKMYKSHLIQAKAAFLASVALPSLMDEEDQ